MADNCVHGAVHRLAFNHYLRTGQRLSSAEWLALQERKFNPYHDALGRFTSPPGVTVSWGAYSRSGGGERGTRRTESANRSARPNSRAREKPRVPSPQGSLPTNASTAFRSEFVRDATLESGHAETYFELNKRQAGLDRLREAAGPKPSAAVEADFRDFRARLEADRARLDARQVEIDVQTRELLRPGLAPFDIASGVANVAMGNGEVRDYLSVLGAVPVFGIIRRTGGIIQIGGAQSVVRRLIKAENIRGIEVHHVPSKASLDLAGIALPPGKTPVIAQLIEDHRLTQSWGGWGKSRQFRQEVAERLARGDVEGALKMEFDDIERIRAGAYSDGAEDVARYIHGNLEKFKR